MTEMSTALPHHKAGKLRILAVASSARSPQVGVVPTMIEAGLKDFLAASYVGLLAPAKTPPDVIDALQKALVKALATNLVQDRFLATGAELVPEPLQTSKGFARIYPARVRRDRRGGEGGRAEAGVGCCCRLTLAVIPALAFARPDDSGVCRGIGEPCSPLVRCFRCTSTFRKKLPPCASVGNSCKPYRAHRRSRGAGASTAAHADSGSIRISVIKAGWFIGASGGNGVLNFRAGAIRFQSAA